MVNSNAPGTTRDEGYKAPSLGFPDPRAVTLREADRINAYIAEGHTVHFQKSAVFPWRRIVRASVVGSMIKFDFDDGSMRLCRCWSEAVDRSEGYALGYNLRETA